MYEQVQAFLGQPMVAPIYILVLLSLLNFVLRVFASLKPGWPGTFSWGMLPQLLDTMVLRKVIPLMFIGLTAYLTPQVQIAGVDLDVRVLLQATYIGGCALAIASEIATIKNAFPGADGAQSTTDG